VRRAVATKSHASFFGLAHRHGLAATTATPCFRAMTRSSQRTTSQGALLGGGSGGGGGDHHKVGQGGQPEGDDSRTSKVIVAILALAPQVAAGLVILGVGGIFHQCALAIPAIQRDITEVRSDLARLESSQARLESSQARLESGQDDLKLMVQRLCVALGKPECAFPPNACA
jgi:hypothetical protein